MFAIIRRKHLIAASGGAACPGRRACRDTPRTGSVCARFGAALRKLGAQLQTEGSRPSETPRRRTCASMTPVCG